MRPLIARLVPLLLLAAPALAQAPPVDVSLPTGVVRCATPDPTPGLLAEYARAVQAYREAGAARQAGAIRIPVVYHIIYDGEDGNLPEAMIQAQTDVLNEAFAYIGLEFFTIEINRVENAEWYRDLNDTSEFQMKSVLARDPEVFLNIYTVSLTDGVLGYAYLPESLVGANQVYDGLVLLDTTLPGGSEAPFNLGDTATHEVGHWAGLLHPFDDGCHDPAACETLGDQVCDTPPIASPSFGCPTDRDSCTDDDEPDLVNNYMDYANDACMDAFTPGQRERALAILNTYRPEIMDGPDGIFAGPTTLAFGDREVNQTERRSVTLYNFTSEPLEVTATLTGDDVFTVAPAAFTVAPSATASVEVSFSPTADVTYSATLTFETDNAEYSTFETAITGGGVLLPAGALDRTGLVLRAESEGTGSGTFVLNNEGLGDFSYSINGAVGYLSAEPASGVLAQDESETVTITGDAAGLVDGVYQRLLLIRTNDANLSTLYYPVVFAVGDALPPPAPLSPLHRSAEVPLEFALDWTPIAEADAYDVEVATDNGFGNVIFSATLDEAGFAATAEPSARLFWRVRTLAGADTSVWSTTFEFTTDDAPVAADAAPAQAAFTVGTPYPNPTTAAFTVPLTLEAAAAVTARVFDLTGRLVGTVAAERRLGPGAHTLAWDAARLAAGVYLVRVEAEGHAASQRLVVLR